VTKVKTTEERVEEKVRKLALKLLYPKRRLTGAARWTETVLSEDTKELSKGGRVYERLTKKVTAAVLEVEFECGHWASYKYNGERQYAWCDVCSDAAADELKDAQP
jgi:hypothetical protein